MKKKILVNVSTKNTSFSKSFKELLANKNGNCGKGNATITYAVNEAAVKTSNRLRAFCQKEAVAIPQTGGWVLTEDKFSALWELFCDGKKEITKFCEDQEKRYDETKSDFEAAQREYLLGRFGKKKAERMLKCIMSFYPSKMALASADVDILCDFIEGDNGCSEETKSIVSKSLQKQASHLHFSGIARELSHIYEIASKLTTQFCAGDVSTRTVGTLQMAAVKTEKREEARIVEESQLYSDLFESLDNGKTTFDTEKYFCDNVPGFLAEIKDIKKNVMDIFWPERLAELVHKYNVSEQITVENMSEVASLEKANSLFRNSRGTEEIPELRMAAELARVVAEKPTYASIFTQSIFTWCYRHRVEDSLPKIKAFSEDELLASAAAECGMDIVQLYNKVIPQD